MRRKSFRKIFQKLRLQVKNSYVPVLSAADAYCRTLRSIR